MTILRVIRLSASLLALVMLASSTLAEGVIPVLQTKTDAYQNVTVVSRTATHVFVQHARGVATVKLSDLSGESLKALGISPETIAAAPTSSHSDDVVAIDDPTSTSHYKSASALSTWANSFKARLASGSSPSGGAGARVLLVLGIIAAVYLFFSYTAMMICLKAGSEPGVLVWVPLLQMIPLLRAAGMSAWWFLGMFVPLLGLVVQIIWCFKISTARGKGILTAIGLVLPVTSLFAWLYLAFSSTGETPLREAKPPVKSMQTEPLPA